MIAGPLCQSQAPSMLLQAELCRVLAWFARRATGRGDVYTAGQVLAALHTLLALSCHSTVQHQNWSAVVQAVALSAGAVGAGTAACMGSNFTLSAIASLSVNSIVICSLLAMAAVAGVCWLSFEMR